MTDISNEVLYRLIQESNAENRERLKRIEARLNRFILFVEEMELIDDEIEGMSVN